MEICSVYEQHHLTEQLQTTMNTVNAQTKLLEDIFAQVAYHQAMLNNNVNMSAVERSAWIASLEYLKWKQNESMAVREQLSEQKVTNEAHLMQQLFYTSQMKEEYVRILKKHEGHASRVVGNVMCANGVDENVYHNRSIDGNHCIKFGDNGKEIVSQITSEMKKVVKEAKHVEYLEKLECSLKEMLGLWYELMCVMKSVNRQDPQDISKFKANTIALNKAIHKFVTDEPIPGTGNTHPTFLKSHLLFDYHIQDFLETWETLGGFDEQSIESTHPQFNQLLRRYGNIRGKRLKKTVVRQFLFERADFIIEMIDDLLESTSKTKRENVKKRGTERDYHSPEIHEDDIGEDLSPALTDMETEMNANQVLHPVLPNYPTLQTQIVVCKCCSKRLLKFGADVHAHEYHSGSITNEFDEVKAEQMAEAAL